MSDIFLSYAKEDRERARVLAAALEDQGWTVFWDRTIPPGLTWHDYIGREIVEARCVLVIWSDSAIRSNWVLEEAGEARKRGVLMPVLLDEVEPPMGFRSLQAVDLSSWRGDTAASGFQQLARGLERLLSSPPGPVAETGPPEEAQPARKRTALEGAKESIWSAPVLAVIGVVLAAIVLLLLYSARNRELTVTLDGAGSGRVTSETEGIDCRKRCSKSYRDDTVVALVAAAEPGSIFVGWGKDCAGGLELDHQADRRLQVTMDADRTCTAIFDLSFELELTLEGTGGGTVAITPPGLQCPERCRASYANNTEVTLVATAYADSAFGGWTPGCAHGVVTMDDDKVCTARFDLIPQITIIELASDFDQGEDGWRERGGVLERESGASCQKAGCLRLTDAAREDLGSDHSDYFYFVMPVERTEKRVPPTSRWSSRDWTRFYGGDLIYWIKLSHQPSAGAAAGMDVVIEGEHGSLTFSIPKSYQPSTEWRAYAIPLRQQTERYGAEWQWNGGVADANDLCNVLRSVTELRIRGEYFTGSWVDGVGDSAWLDEVSLRPAGDQEDPGSTCASILPTG